jgi:glyoxylase-like metal-dependent hydrolase (beta-lactamase superfamily II)
MRISQTGKITADFYNLGHIAAPVYLLDGPKPVLFDAGFTTLASLYMHEINNVLGSRSPACLFITHAHWDHVGSAGYFKERWPEMVINGSEEAQKILKNEKAVQFISKFNENTKAYVKTLGVVNINNESFKPFHIDYTLGPNENIKTGENCHVHAIPTPGHTRDFFSYWIPERKILIASESAGTDFGNGVIGNEFLTDYDTYRLSLSELVKLDIQVLCLGHKIVLKGRDAKDHMNRSLEDAEKYVSMVEDVLLEVDGDIERAVFRLKEAEWSSAPSPKQPEHAYMVNTRIRVEKIWERMQNGIFTRN